MSFYFEYLSVLKEIEPEAYEVLGKMIKGSCCPHEQLDAFETGLVCYLDIT